MIFVQLYENDFRERIKIKEEVIWRHAAKKMAVGTQDVESSRVLDALPYYDQGYEASGTQEVVRFVLKVT